MEIYIFPHREFYPNGYGISVVREPDGFSFEVAVLRHDGNGNFSIIYTTPITNDVLRYQTALQVTEAAKRVQAL